ncbi:winged helix-turn-helix transcriptional regulator [Amycolatopsis nigrescens]|uniref:winged helix-turn-helix transcriptional regulator n=1 Tax=Amycolatopsis nigrescens TaxID=381445 RepID=UPI0003776080|nr:helix-turn-helix domain-containing protein [Amycolatopsis nigrescens]
MALGTGYDQQGCYLARALEVVGERWTLLILRDCFYGVRRFTDLREHLDISRAVLTARLETLLDAGVLTREDRDGHPEYLLTDAGHALWPTIFTLSKWGEQYTTGPHPTRVFSHAACGTDLDDHGHCPACGHTPPPADLIVRPGTGRNAMRRDDRVASALDRPHRMLTPIEH